MSPPLPQCLAATSRPDTSAVEVFTTLCEDLCALSWWCKCSKARGVLDHNESLGMVSVVSEFTQVGKSSPAAQCSGGRIPVIRRDMSIGYRDTHTNRQANTQTHVSGSSPFSTQPKKSKTNTHHIPTYHMTETHQAKLHENQIPAHIHIDTLTIIQMGPRRCKNFLQ